MFPMSNKPSILSTLSGIIVYIFTYRNRFSDECSPRLSYECSTAPSGCQSPLDQVNQSGLWVRLQVAVVYMAFIIAIDYYSTRKLILIYIPRRVEGW